MSRSQSGSTMTINTIGNGKDDVSIYNGDENHKVCTSFTGCSLIADLAFKSKAEVMVIQYFHLYSPGDVLRVYKKNFQK